MKKLIFIAVLWFWTSSVLAALWTQNFPADYDSLGLDMAVGNAIESGATALDILSFIITNSEKYEVRETLKALFSAGVDSDVVRNAANKLGIATEKVNQALQESIQESPTKQTLSDRDIIDFDNGLGAGPFSDHIINAGVIGAGVTIWGRFGGISGGGGGGVVSPGAN